MKSTWTSLQAAIPSLCEFATIWFSTKSNRHCFGELISWHWHCAENTIHRKKLPVSTPDQDAWGKIRWRPVSGAVSPQSSNSCGFGQEGRVSNKTWSSGKKKLVGISSTNEWCSVQCLKWLYNNYTHIMCKIITDGLMGKTDHLRATDAPLKPFFGKERQGRRQQDQDQ